MATLLAKTTQEQGNRRKSDQSKSANTANRDEPHLFKLGSISQNDPSGTTQRPSSIKVKSSKLIMFATQLSVMLDSGVVLSDALDAIVEQAEQDVFKVVITNVSEMVKAGETFSKTLTRYPKVFDLMFISMVKAAEASGKMAEMLRVLSEYLNFEDRTRKRVKGALTYPLIMAMMAVIATASLMFFVLPRFAKIYEARGAALPKLTQLLVSFSKMSGDLQLMMSVLTGIVLVAIGFSYWIETLAGRRTIDYLKISIPLIGTMFVDVVITRSMRILATMLGAGVSMLDSIEVVEGSCRNYYFQRLWSEVRQKIRDGYQLSESIKISATKKLIAPGIIQMLRAGEKSGNISKICDKISVFYEEKLEGTIKNVLAVLEPAMLIILGGFIGTIAIALLLPVFKISSVIAQ